MVRRLKRGKGKRRKRLTAKNAMAESDGQSDDGWRSVGTKKLAGLGEKAKGSVNLGVSGDRGQPRWIA